MYDTQVQLLSLKIFNVGRGDTQQQLLYQTNYNYKIKIIKNINTHSKRN